MQLFVYIYIKIPPFFQGSDTIIQMHAFQENPRAFNNSNRLTPDECCKWTLLWIALTSALQIVIIITMVFLKPWFEDMREKITFIT